MVIIRLKARHPADDVHTLHIGPSVCVSIPDAPSRGDASEKLSAHVHTGGDTFELGILYIEAADDRFIGNFGATRVTMEISLLVAIIGYEGEYIGRASDHLCGNKTQNSTRQFHLIKVCGE